MILVKVHQNTLFFNVKQFIQVAFKQYRTDCNKLYERYIIQTISLKLLPFIEIDLAIGCLRLPGKRPINQHAKQKKTRKNFM